MIRLRLDNVAEGIVSNPHKENVLRDGLKLFQGAKLEKGLKKREVEAIRKFTGILIGLIMCDDGPERDAMMTELKQLKGSLPDYPVDIDNGNSSSRLK